MGQLSEWKNVQAPAQASSVLSVLLRTGDYETAKHWCAYVSFPQQKFLVISEHYELSILWIFKNILHIFCCSDFHMNCILFIGCHRTSTVHTS